MPDPSPRDVTGLIAGEMDQARRDLHASPALARPDSAVRVPIVQLRAVEELTGTGKTGLAR